jgi:hypothetical protein
MPAWKRNSNPPTIKPQVTENGRREQGPKKECNSLAIDRYSPNIFHLHTGTNSEEPPLYY